MSGKPGAFRPSHFTAGGGRANSRGKIYGWNGRASQTFADRSQLPVRMHEPSALNIADETQLVCPLSVRTSAPLFASQTFAAWSQLAVTMRAPSGLNQGQRAL